MDPSPKDFKYNLHRFVIEYRRELLHACHVLIGVWVQAGCPRGDVILASFDAWSEVLGGIMEVIGVEGFLQNRFDYLTAKDDEVDAWAAMAQGIWEKSEGQRFTASDVISYFSAGMDGTEWVWNVRSCQDGCGGRSHPDQADGHADLPRSYNQRWK